jgi:hypothetical protein
MLKIRRGRHLRQFLTILSTFLVWKRVINGNNKIISAMIILTCTTCILRDFFLNYRTINIKTDIFYSIHRIINRIVKLPLSHRLMYTITPMYHKYKDRHMEKFKRFMRHFKLISMNRRLVWMHLEEH